MISTEILNSTLVWHKLTQGEADAYGKPANVYTPSGSTACCITSTRRDNAVVATVGGRQIVYSHVLYCDPGLALAEGDNVVVDSRTYRIVQICIPAGRGNHIRAGLVSVTP